MQHGKPKPTYERPTGLSSDESTTFFDIGSATVSWLVQFRKSPRPEFEQDLYARISKPMKAARQLVLPRRIALAFATLIAAVGIALVGLPSTEAFGDGLLRKIGAILFFSDTAVPKAGPTAAPPTGLQVQFATNAAEASRVAGFQVLAPAYLPGGYALEGQWSVFPQGQGMIAVSDYVSPAKHFLHLDQFKPGSGDQYEEPLGSSSEVSVRGQPGLWITGRQLGNSPGSLIFTNWLMWEEKGVNYTLYGDTLTLDEMLRVAESLGR